RSEAEQPADVADIVAHYRRAEREVQIFAVVPGVHHPVVLSRSRACPPSPCADRASNDSEPTGHSTRRRGARTLHRPAGFASPAVDARTRMQLRSVRQRRGRTRVIPWAALALAAVGMAFFFAASMTRWHLAAAVG